MVKEVQKELRKFADPQKVNVMQRYFRTGKGEYGEGDIFIGVVVPDTRLVAKKFKDLSFDDLSKLLTSKIHEERLTALFILVLQFQKGTEKQKKRIYQFYMSHLSGVNNWDLVDSSADKIIGKWLVDKDTTILKKLAESENLWKRRISIMATFESIRNGNPELTFTIADILLTDTEDLIQKAVGWMLREVGKLCSEDIEETFLKTRYKKMPRTTLRYAIERFPNKKRLAYLQGQI